MTPDCTCGHPQSKHKSLKLGCRGCDLGCARFEPGEAAEAAEKQRVLTAVAEVCEDQADKARVELGHMSFSARLAEVERERDEVLAVRASVEEDLANTIAEFNQAMEELRERHRIEWRLERDACVKLRGERDAARADLASARQEIEQLRAAAADHLQAWNPAEEIYAYDAWQCLKPGGCGSRYIPATAAEDHPHPLTPVRVTITHRTEGHTE